MPKSHCFLTYAAAALSCAIAGIVLFSSADAHAQEYDHERERRGRLMLALDFDYSSAIKSPEIKYGAGGALRIGSQRNLFLVTLIPELLFDYHNYDVHTRDNAQIVTGKIGGRIRFLKIVEPGLFAHIGLGHVGGYDVISHTGVAFDAGLTLDLTILPLIDLGLHGSWNRVFGGFDSGTAYASAGAHVALVL
jgi:hypothetical protein